MSEETGLEFDADGWSSRIGHTDFCDRCRGSIAWWETVKGPKIRTKPRRPRFRLCAECTCVEWTAQHGPVVALRRGME